MSYPNTPQLPNCVVQRGKWPGQFLAIANTDAQVCQRPEEAESICFSLVEMFGEKAHCMFLGANFFFRYEQQPDGNIAITTGNRAKVETDPRRAILADKGAILHLHADLLQYMADYAKRPTGLVLPSGLRRAIDEERPREDPIYPETAIIHGYNETEIATINSKTTRRYVITNGDYDEQFLNNQRCYHTDLKSPGDVEHWTFEQFIKAEEVVKLSGAEFQDSHDCSNKELRDSLNPVLIKSMLDRLQCLGDCPNDTFTGLKHACMSAKLLSGAPRLEQITSGGAPVICVAAGPSLTDSFGRLRALQKKCIIISADAALAGLLANDIIPDMVAPLERVAASRDHCRQAEGTDIIYAGLPVVYPDAVSMFNRHIAVSCGDRLYKWLYPDANFAINAGSSTGVLATSIACSLARGKAPVYLVGHDLCTRDGATHYESAPDVVTGEWEKAKKLAADKGYEERKMPSTDGKVVTGIAWWDRFRQELSQQAGMYNMSCNGKIINVCKDGALIRGAPSGMLPQAGQLPDKRFELPKSKASQWERMKRIGKKLPEDAETLKTHYLKHLDEDKNLLWRLAGVDSCSAASMDNKLAFQYTLRSLVWYANVMLHQHCRWRPKWHAIAAAHVAITRYFGCAGRLLASEDWTMEGAFDE